MSLVIQVANYFSWLILMKTESGIEIIYYRVIKSQTILSTCFKVWFVVFKIQMKFNIYIHNFFQITL